MNVPKLKWSNHREYVEALLAATGAAEPASLLVPAMRRIMDDLSVRDSPMYTGDSDWDADYYMQHHTDLRAEFEDYVSYRDEDRTGTSELVEAQINMLALVGELGGLPAARVEALRTPRRTRMGANRTPGTPVMTPAAIAQRRMNTEVAKVAKKAEEWLYGMIATTTANNDKCADLYLRANRGRGLKLFALLI